MWYLLVSLLLACAPDAVRLTTTFYLITFLYVSAMLPTSYAVDVLLILSNLAFLIPSTVAIFWNRWTRAVAYFMVVIWSSAYHTCRSYGALCVLPFGTLKNLDFFWADLGIPLTALYLINFKPRYQWIERWLIIAFGMGVFILQIKTDGELLPQAIICGVSLSIVLLYWLIWEMPTYDWSAIAAGIAFTIVSILMFTTQGAFMLGYWGVHSIWHVLGAFGQTYFLMCKEPASPYAAIDAKITSNIRIVPKISCHQ